MTSIDRSVEERERRARFTDLVTRHSAHVYHLAYAVLGERAAAEDVCQEVFTRLWKNGDSFAGRSAFTTWLYAVTRNAAISERRKLVLRGVLGKSREQDSGDSHEQAGETKPEDFLQTRRLTKAIAGLPAPMQRVVRLYYLEEESVEQVAAALEIPVGSVKTLLYRSRAMLRESLNSSP